MAFKLTPKPPQEVILPAKVERDLTPLERVIERSDIKIDVAACIRWFWFGLTGFVTALTGLAAALSAASDGEPRNVERPAIERQKVQSSNSNS